MTFEDCRLIYRSKELARFLRHIGEEVWLYSFDRERNILGGGDGIEKYLQFHPGCKVLDDLSHINDFSVWFFDLTTWSSTHIDYSELLMSFPGKLVCINFEDGYGFFEHRISPKVGEKVDVFLNNALYIDRDRYPTFIRNKCCLVPSYISNSQDFKNDNLLYKKKIDRVFFSGCITGYSTNDNNPILQNNEYKCRANWVNSVKNSGLQNILRVWHYEPVLKEIYDKLVPSDCKGEPFDRVTFKKLLSESSFVLSPRGNSWPTNRFFESQAAGSLTFCNPRPGIDVYGIGKNRKHYVECDVTGEDLVSKVRYFSKNKKEARKIAKNGRIIWEKKNMLDDTGLWPKETINYMTENLIKPLRS